MPYLFTTAHANTTPLQTLSPEEQRLFRMYGKLPIAKRLTVSCDTFIFKLSPSLAFPILTIIF